MGIHSYIKKGGHVDRHGQLDSHEHRWNCFWKLEDVLDLFSCLRLFLIPNTIDEGWLSAYIKGGKHLGNIFILWFIEEIEEDKEFLH